MTNEVQKIIQEIERQIEEGKVKCQQSKENNDHESFVAWSEHVATCGRLLVFINSLLKEPTSEDKSEKELSETYLAIFDKKYPILPTLKGNQKADFKNFLNKCQQEFGLKEFGIHPTQSKLFEKLTLLWAAWGAEHLGGLGESNKYEFDKEPASKDLDFLVISLEETIGTSPHSREVIKEHLQKAAEWQKDRDYKMYAHVPLKDIRDAWQELKKNKPDIENYPAVCFQKGADWQKQKNFEELFKSDMTLFKECYEKGRLDMREEMMKDAVDATILDIDTQTIEFGLWPEKLLDIKEGDKVKIVIVKSENNEQYF